MALNYFPINRSKARMALTWLNDRHNPAMNLTRMQPLTRAASAQVIARSLAAHEQRGDAL